MSMGMSGGMSEDERGMLWLVTWCIIGLCSLCRNASYCIALCWVSYACAGE